MYVLGTAGHVDHGKSTLIKALTGIDPDRLKEEKNRQMTIDLGFAWYQLPSGNQVGIVDVPGHRDFIENMLAGIGGIDAVLLVIAADEGVMPQTREHLAILKLLQIQNGLIVLTKIDQVDDEDWINLVEEDIRSLVNNTFLASAPIIKVSAIKGIGLEELAQSIDTVLQNCQPKRNIGRPRLPIDRVFSLKGFGTVVTGTLIDGEFTVGQQVEVLPGKIPARIRGIQTHKKKVEIALPGNRTAINLAGLDASDIHRGNVVLNPDVFTETKRVDAKIEMVAEATGKIKHNDYLKIFLGAAQAVVRIRLLGKKEVGPGEWGWVQMEFDEPVVAVKGDRFVLRRPSPAETIAGGIILDAHPAKRYKRFSEPVLERMQMLEKGSPSELLLAKLASSEPASYQEFIQSSGMDVEEARRTIEDLLGREMIQVGMNNERDALLVTRTYWEILKSKIITILNTFYSEHPLLVGIARQDLIKQLKFNPKRFNLMLQTLISEGVLKEQGDQIGLADHQIVFSPTEEENSGRITQELKEAKFAPTTISDLGERFSPDLVWAMIQLGMLVQISDDIAFLPDAFKRMMEQTLAFLEKESKITLAQVRDMFQTSRKYALAFLEYLDEERITERKEDFRVLK